MSVVIEDFTNTTDGVVPASGGGTSKYLRADGAWAVPPVGSGSGGASIYTNVMDYGAVGDGTADDSSAIQDAIDAAASTTSKTVYLPTGYYLANSLVAGNGIVILGDSPNASVIAAGSVDATVLTHNGGYGQIRNIAIYGKGTNNDNSTFGATEPAFVLGTNFVHGLVSHVATLGGSHALLVNANDCALEYVTATTSFGSAIVKITTGCWLHRCKNNLSTPVPTLPAPFDPVAWAASTAYVVGEIVSLDGFLIQCTAAGTSDTSSPTLKNYELSITDNTATWQLVSPNTYYGVQCDTGAMEVTMSQCDFSGYHYAGLALTNTLAGQAPSSINLSQCILGGQRYNAISANSGFNLSVANCSIGGGLAANVAAIALSGDFERNMRVIGCYFSGTPTGIEVGAGAHHVIANNTFYNSANAAINLNSGIGETNITGNVVSDSAGFGLRIQGTTGDYILATGNSFDAGSAGIQNSSTASHNVITNNN